MSKGEDGEQADMDLKVLMCPHDSAASTLLTPTHFSAYLVLSDTPCLFHFLKGPFEFSIRFSPHQTITSFLPTKTQ